VGLVHDEDMVEDHSRVGLVVTPVMCRRRVPCSRNASAYSLRPVAVSRWKKSAAMMPWAWFVRNSLQVGPVRRGAGSMPAACRIYHTVEVARGWPRRAISPWIRRCPIARSLGRAAGPEPVRVLVADRFWRSDDAAPHSHAGGQATRRPSRCRGATPLRGRTTPCERLCTALRGSRGHDSSRDRAMVVTCSDDFTSPTASTGHRCGEQGG
jgi:hypothetical protein